MTINNSLTGKIIAIEKSLLILIIFIISSCNFSKNARTNNAEYGSLLWVNNKMPDSIVKKAVKYTVENSSLIIAQIPWEPNDKKSINYIEWYNTLAVQHGKSLMINIDWLSNNRNSTRNGNWSFDSDTIKDQFSKDMISIVDKFKPKFLMLGVEVNYYALISSKGYNDFIKTFNSLKESFEKKYPKMQVGLSFQLELLYGIDKNWTHKKTLEPLNAIVENLDFIGVSTYPDLKINTIEKSLISKNYIDSLFTQYDIPIGISETGISNLNFSDNQRSRYIQNIFSESERLDFIIWGSMIDPCVEDKWMNRIGLLNYNALPKKEYDIWLKNINDIK